MPKRLLQGPRHLRRRMSRRLRVWTMRGSYLSASGAFMLAGVASVPSPVPIGFVLFVVGLYFLARSSRRGRQSVKWLRRQSPTFSRGLNRLKSRLPGRMRKFVESSDPGE